MRAALALEEIDTDIYRQRHENLWVPPMRRSVFGGQIAAGAMRAAQLSAGDAEHSGMTVASLHSYFLSRGDPARDIVYKVSRLRTGKSFSTRSVVAVQHGQAIFGAEVQLHRTEPGGPEHQSEAPAAPDPDTLPSLRDLYRSMLAVPKIKSAHGNLILKYIEAPFPVDIKLCAPQQWNPLQPKRVWPAKQMVWMRCTEALGDDANLHQSAVTYASDWSLASTMLLPHSISFASSRVAMIASLDHVMHWAGNAAFRADEWLLFDLESPLLHGARGLNIGRIFTRDGRLVAHCLQEAVVRMRDDAPAPAAAAGAAAPGGVPYGGVA